MKRLFRIFDLTKNEQRIVLMVVLFLIAIAFIGYERRTHHLSVRPATVTEPEWSPRPGDTGNKQ